MNPIHQSLKIQAPQKHKRFFFFPSNSWLSILAVGYVVLVPIKTRDYSSKWKQLFPHLSVCLYVCFPQNLWLFATKGPCSINSVEI
jgi:hypothetical protein